MVPVRKSDGRLHLACPIQDKPPPWDADPRLCREFGPEDYGDEDIVAFLRKLMAHDHHVRHRIRMNEESGRLQLWHYDPSLDDFYDDDEEEEGEREGARGRNKSQSTLCGLRKSLLCQASRSWSSPSPPPRPWSSPSPPRSAFSCGRPPSPFGPSLLQLEMPQKLLVTEEEADRLAEELVAEEEQAKRRAEKKRLKKRQKERKRQERLEQESGGTRYWKGLWWWRWRQQQAQQQPAQQQGRAALPPAPRARIREELDLSSTVVSQARRKVGDRPPNTRRKKELSPSWNHQSPSPQEGSRSQSPQPEALPGLQAAALRQSQELASRAGYSCSLEGLVSGSCAPLHEGYKAQPSGLQRFKEAADVFRETLAMDKSQPDAVHELQQCLLQLTLQQHGAGIHDAALKPRILQQLSSPEAGALGFFPLSHSAAVSPWIQGLLPPPRLPSALWPISQAQRGSFWSSQLQDFTKARGILGQPPHLPPSRFGPRPFILPVPVPVPLPSVQHLQMPKTGSL